MPEKLNLKTGIRYKARWFDHRGRRQSQNFNTKDAAARHERKKKTEVEAILAGHVPNPDDLPAIPSLDAAADEWLENPIKNKGAKRQHLKQHIRPYFEGVLISEVPAKAQEFVWHLETKPRARHNESNEAKEPLAHQTIKNVMMTLSSLLSHYGYSLPKLKYNKQQEREREWIKNPKDCRKLIDVCEGWVRVAAALSLYSGMRKGEVAGLIWSDIDWANKVIRISKSYDYQPTKNHQNRLVPMPPELEEILSQWYQVRDGDPIVVNNNEERIEPDYDIASIIQSRCRRAGIEVVGFQALRHTFGFHQAEHGTNIKDLRDLMGHESVATTEIYIHRSETPARSARSHLSFA